MFVGICEGTLSLSLAPCVIFEVNKVHINDKTSQSSEQGGLRRGQGKKTDNKVILRA